MHDIAEFLRTHSPFDSLDEETLIEVAESAEIEFYAAREKILDSADVVEFAYVVRSGSVELVIDGRLLDLIGEGEMFGFVSLLSEGPLGFEARAAEDTLVYRIPADVIRPVLERPAFVRFVTGVMNERLRFLAGHQPEAPLSSTGRPVGELIRAAGAGLSACDERAGGGPSDGRGRRDLRGGRAERRPRDRDRPRHSHSCGGRGRRPGDPAVGRDDRPGLDRGRRPHRHRGAARDARPRDPASAGALRPASGCSGCWTTWT